MPKNSFKYVAVKGIIDDLLKRQIVINFFVWGSIFGPLFSCSGGSYKVIRNTLKSFFIKLNWVQFNVFDLGKCTLEPK